MPPNPRLQPTAEDLLASLASSVPSLARPRLSHNVRRRRGDPLTTA